MPLQLTPLYMQVPLGTMGLLMHVEIFYTVHGYGTSTLLLTPSAQGKDHNHGS